MLFVVELDSRLEKSADKRISVERFREIFEIYVEDKLEELKRSGSEKYDKDCRDFNYFMDDVKDVFINNDLVKIPVEVRKSIWETHVDKNLPTLMKNTTSCKCIRKEHNYNKEYRDMTQTLEDFCEEKTRMREIIDQMDYDESLYVNFNKWINKKKEDILKEYEKLSNKDKYKHLLKISETCDLNHVDKLFLNISSENMKKMKEDVKKQHLEVKVRPPVNEPIDDRGKEDDLSRGGKRIILNKEENSPTAEITTEYNPVSEMGVGTTIAHSEPGPKTVNTEVRNVLRSGGKISDQGSEISPPKALSNKQMTPAQRKNVPHFVERRGYGNSHVRGNALKKISNGDDNYKSPSSNYIEVDCAEDKYFLLEDGTNPSENSCKTKYDYFVSNDYDGTGSAIYSTDQVPSREEIKSPDSLSTLNSRVSTHNLNVSNEGNPLEGGEEKNNVTINEQNGRNLESSVGTDKGSDKNEEEVAATCGPNDGDCIDANQIPVEYLRKLSRGERSGLDGSSNIKHIISNNFDDSNMIFPTFNFDFDILKAEEEVLPVNNSDIIYGHEEVEETTQEGASIFEKHSHTSSQQNDSSASGNKYRMLSTTMELPNQQEVFGLYSPVSRTFGSAMSFLKNIFISSSSPVSQRQGQSKESQLAQISTTVQGPIGYRTSPLQMNAHSVGAGINISSILSMLGLSSGQVRRSGGQGSETYLTGSDGNVFHKNEVIPTIKDKSGKTQIVSNEKGGIFSKGITSMMSSLPVALVTFVFLFMFLVFNKVIIYDNIIF